MISNIPYDLNSSDRAPSKAVSAAVVTQFFIIWTPTDRCAATGK
jgi:hypothetical protein